MIALTTPVHKHVPTKEDEGRYAWRSAIISPGDGVGETLDPNVTKPAVVSHDTKNALVGKALCLDDHPAQTSLESMKQDASSLGCISFKLHKWNALAGSVLAHCVRVIEGLFNQWKPMIHKIGCTHNPAFRWSNKLYGYAHQKDGWTNMVCLSCAPEPFSACMLEAALIQMFKSILSYQCTVYEKCDA